MTPPWHQLSPEQVADVLDVDPAQGLGLGQVAERLARHGSNTLPQVPPPSLFALAARQARSLIVILLLVAGVLSLVLGEGLDALGIFAALLLNLGIGVFMDYQAEREIATLQTLTGPKARVRRAGNVAELEGRNLVPGDVVLLEAGDRVPADGRLLSGELATDESLLTGESTPVVKRPDRIMAETLPLAGRLNEAFAGGLVTIGSGTMVVTSTGEHTEVGRIGRLLSETIRPKAPLSERLDALGRYLVWTVAAVAVLIVLLGLWQGQAMGPLTETAIVLAIAAIPEGLPSVATLALAAGAKRLAGQGLRLRHIGALEALGSITTLCLDKTGTLTANAMTVQEIRVAGHRITVSGEGWVPQGEFHEEGAPLTSPTRELLGDLLRAAQWCNDATLEAHDGTWHIHGDPSEGALLVAAAKAGLADARAQVPRRIVFPAGRGHPWMLVAYAFPDQTVAFVKGAPEEVLARCATSRDEHGAHPLGDEERASWLKRNREMADAALRVFGVAVEPEAPADPTLKRNWEWLGLIGMSDPPRPDALMALKEAHRAGIRTVMITGDQAPTALAIARKLDLASGQEPQVVIGARPPVPEASVYARATPESKFALVQALQESGQVVAMTGDGVNDAPALRAAVVGIAMGHGTDVARDAASVVLMDERLSTMLTGIKEGRSAFLNIQKAIDYLLTCSTTMMLAILLAVAAGYPSPLLPLQILYLNLLMHSFPALGLAMEPSSPGVMTLPPLPRHTVLVSASRLASILWHAVIISVATLAMWAWGWSHGGAAHGRTLAFATLASALILHTFSDRSPKPFGGWEGGRNLTLLVCVGVALGLQVAAIHWLGLRNLLQLTALDFADWLNVVVAAIATGVAVEISKKAIPPV